MKKETKDRIIGAAIAAAIIIVVLLIVSVVYYLGIRESDREKDNVVNMCSEELGLTDCSSQSNLIQWQIVKGADGEGNDNERVFLVDPKTLYYIEVDDCVLSMNEELAANQPHYR